MFKVFYYCVKIENALEWCMYQSPAAKRTQSHPVRVPNVCGTSFKKSQKQDDTRAVHVQIPHEDVLMSSPCGRRHSAPRRSRTASIEGLSPFSFTTAKSRSLP
mmetsp:Transcript_20217/g.43334  ORF Transcript_20217/g.43334 Transcript_20217/m.43334 type:complete len:103 (+) Transcript_20217:38-346(+)